MTKHCPLTGVNIIRFLATVLAGFAFIFAFDFVIHGNVLKDLYEQTAHLWRTEEEWMAHFPFMLGSQFLIALITAFIFTRNYEGTGISEGVRFGSMLGALFAVMMSMSYAWMPIPLLLAIYWAMAGLMQGLGLGIIFALIYRK